ncbi:MAG TPA: SCO family protein, partial [Alcanivorax sp.]|nr:SCO family protein [Alcanivorax sp.]
MIGAVRAPARFSRRARRAGERMKTRIRIGLALLLAALTLAGCGDDPGSDLPVNTRLGGDFTLTDHNGEPFRLSSLEGRVVILFFGYTH